MNRKEKLLQEFKLRRLIRKALLIKKAKERKGLNEEKKLRYAIRTILSENVDADTQPAPYSSTALSALADAFNQILPVLKTGLRKLRRPEERQSYRAHVLQKFDSMFENFEGFDKDEGGMIGESGLNEQEEDQGLKIKIDDPGRILPSDGKEDERFKEKAKPKLDPDEKDIESLAIDTEDPTGARFAFNTINNSNIEKLLADTRKLLPRDEDKQEFKDYALYNIDLWLLTYEKEIADEQGQPPAFDKVVTPKPAGAEVKGGAQEFETTDDVGDTGDDMDLEGLGDLGDLEELEPEEQSLDIPTLGEHGDADFVTQMEEILMMENFDVGE